MAYLNKQKSSPLLKNIDNRCVCQICTCGTHRCPTQQIPCKPETTHQQHYKAFQINRQKPKGCVYQLSDSHYDQNLLKSSYQENYQFRKVCHSHHCKKYAYQPNSAKFHDETQYNQKYVEKKIAHEGNSHCQSQYRPNPAKFNGKSTYNDEFKAKKVNLQGSCKKHHAYQPNSGKFYDQTQYNEKYIENKIIIEKPSFCENEYRPNAAKFDGNSTYKSQFKQKRVEHQSPHKHCAYQPNKAKFHDETQYNQKYVPNKIVVEDKNPCISQYRPNTAKFDGKSSYREEFKAKKAEPNEPKKHCAYQPNNAKFHDETQYNQRYVPNKIVVEGPSLCKSQYFAGKTKFEGKSTYKQSFKGAKSIAVYNKSNYQYQPNKAPFYDHTTYGDAFKGIQIEGEDGCCYHCQCSLKQDNKAKFEGNSNIRENLKEQHAQKQHRCLIEQLPQRPQQCAPGKQHIHFLANQCKWN